MINFEGGAIPEEYHTAYVIDRVNTTGTVWLGLTVGCAQCHDHKFDPITQKEYLQPLRLLPQRPRERPRRLEGERRADDPEAPHAPSSRRRSTPLTAEISARRGEAEASPMARAGRRASRLGEVGLSGDADSARWTALDPDLKMTSRGKAKLVQGGRPLRSSSGREPGQGRLHAHCNPAEGTSTITGIRLEALPDDRAHKQRPGPVGQRQHRADRRHASTRRPAMPTSPSRLALPIRLGRLQPGGLYPASLVRHRGQARDRLGHLPREGKPHAAVFSNWPSR